MSFKDWKKEFSGNKVKILLSLVFLIVSLILYYYSGLYVSNNNSVREVTDLILDNIPAIDLSFIFVWLFLLVVITFVIYSFSKPKKMPYYLGTLGLFLLIRAVFISLTHLKDPSNVIPVHFPWIANRLLFSNDLFFSGHVGLAFLGYLLFKEENKKIGYFFLISSIIFSFVVLFMHQHYSIDVLAAFFISYGIYRISKKWFNKKL